MKKNELFLLATILFIMSSCNNPPQSAQTLLSVDPNFDASAFVPLEQTSIPVNWTIRRYEHEVDVGGQSARFAVVLFETTIDWDGDGIDDRIEIRYDDELLKQWEDYQSLWMKEMLKSRHDPSDDPVLPERPAEGPCQVCTVSFSVNGDDADRMILPSLALDDTLKRSFFYKANKESTQLSFALRDDGPSADAKYYLFSKGAGKTHYVGTLSFRDKVYIDGRGNYVSSWQVTHMQPYYVFGWYDKHLRYQQLEGRPPTYDATCGKSEFPAFFKAHPISVKSQPLVTYFSQEYAVKQPASCQVKQILFYDREDVDGKRMQPAEYFVEFEDGRKGYLAYFDGD
jgi:hypothetical protein